MSKALEDPRIGIVLQERYRILERIAHGAMGIVYRGERVQIERPVAIKFLHSPLVEEQQFLKRFERELRLMSKLSHPNCVSVIDFGVDEAPYVVMDYVTGQTLSSLLDEQGPVEVGRAVHITRQMLAGLAHAHEQGIVHRDVKAINVMLSNETGHGDHVRILDFGLAIVRDAPKSDLSHAHVAMGTPNYMSPEQARAMVVDARSDIYSTGIVLFELLTGLKPFDADTVSDILRRQQSDPVPKLGQVAPDVEFPPGLQEVLERALAKEPSDRYPSALQFSEALEPFVDRAAVEVPVRSERSVLLFAGVAAALIFIAGTAYALWPSALEIEEQPARVARQTSAPAPAPVPAPAPAPAPVPVPMLFPVAVPTPVPMPDAAPLVETANAVPATATPDAAPAADAAVLAAPAEDEHELDGLEEEEANTDEELPVEEQAEPVAPVPETATAAAQAEPTTEAEATTAAPAPPVVAPTIAAAVDLIEQKRSEEAIAALRALKTRMPKNAYVSYLLGNLYFEKSWWTVGMDQYRAAIQHSRAYRKKPILTQNVIRALGNHKTRPKAMLLLTRVIGSPAVAHLKRAAKNDRNPEVRRQADVALRRIRARN